MAGVLDSCGDGSAKSMYMLSLGFPSNHFTARAGKLLTIAAQAVATSEEGASGEAFLYGPDQGSPAYRDEVAKFLTADYGEPVNSESIHITAGATQGLHFLTSHFLRSGDIVFVEDPSYFIALKLLREDLGMTIVPVPTDADGLDVDKLEQLITQHCTRTMSAKRKFHAMLYTMPTFHNPTGRCLSEARCRRLVEVARNHNILILCDDVYTLLHYTGDEQPPRRLLSYEKEMYGDDQGNVISNGTFSKILSPGIRVGWIECCKDIMAMLNKSNIAWSGGSFNHYGSLLVAHLLQTGLEQKMVEDMRTEHTERLKAVNKILKDQLPLTVKYTSPKGGYFYWLELPLDTDMDAIKQAADHLNVTFIQGKSCSPSGCYENCIRFSISKYAETELVKGVSLLCEAINKVLN